ncbi:MAG: TRAM domain-containing protein, partial [Flavobacteriales bacterium]
DVPEDVKGRRLSEIIEAQKLNSAKRMASYVGQVHEVLIEGVSKRSDQNMYGRNTQNSVVIVPRFTSSQLSVVSCQAALGGDGKPGHSANDSMTDLTTDNRQLTTKELRPGDILKVRIVSATAGSLQGEPISSITELVQHT